MQRSRALVAAALAVAIVIGIAWWVQKEGAARRAVLDMPPAERAETYRRELASFRALCGTTPRPDGLADECHDRAEFILTFPECDDACRTRARAHQPPPSR